MSVPARLAAFAVVLVAAFGLSYTVGAALVDGSGGQPPAQGRSVTTQTVTTLSTHGSEHGG